MKTRLKPYFYLVPLAYLLLAGLFLHLQGAGDRQTLNYQVGPAAVSGSRSGERISANLRLFGRTIDLNDEILYKSSDDPDFRTLSLQGITGDQNRVSISYSEGVSLELTPQGAAGEASEDAVVSLEVLIASESTVESVVLSGGSSAEAWNMRPLSHLPVVLMENQGEQLLFDLENSSLNVDGSIVFSGNGSSLSALSGFGDDPVRFWFFRGSDPVNRGAYESAIRGYLDSAYNGWRSGRYHAATDTWLLPDGSRQFQESALVSMVAEGFRRRDSVDLNAINGISARHSDHLTWLSSPYVGSLVITDEARRKTMTETINLLRRHGEAQDPALFSEVDQLAEYLLLAGDQRLISRVSALFSSDAFAEAALTPLQLAGMVEFYVDAGNLYPERFPGYEQLYARIDSHLLPKIRRIEDGLYLVDNGKVHMRASLKAGYYLQEIGRGEDKPLLEELGRSMVVSVLSRGDANSVLPASLVLSKAGSSDFQEGFLLPESVYPLLADNSYYPQNLFFHKEFGDEVSLWSVGQSISAGRSGDSYSIGFTFPTGSTHHLVVRNVPPFAYIELYGIRWNGTRQFQLYDAGGWYYDRDTRSLYVKVRHRRSREELVIHFTEPEE
jgi:hypothetical protein